MDYDFSGWATKNNILCSDGRTILKDAFKDNDQQVVPLVWNHDHNSPTNVLGHALLENREEGVYTYCKFNDTESGQHAKALVVNGDVDQLSIYANKLKSMQNRVIHGCIREVSLVLAGANPGAYIDSVICHSDDGDTEEFEGVIYTDEPIDVVLEDSGEESEDSIDDKGGETMNDEVKTEVEEVEETEEVEEIQHADEDQDPAEFFDTFTDEQKDFVYALVGQALEEGAANANEGESEEEYEDEGEEENMKHNVFDQDTNEEVLMHSEIVASAIADAKKFGSMKDSFIEHAAINNITDIDKLFPEATEINPGMPRMIEEDNSWVAKVMRDVKHSPFSRVKATFGRITEADARAKGYIKGNKKTNFKLAALNRITTPTTVYIKNEIDRDDVVDITSFDVIAWQKREMRKLLDKELARAILFGDGRDVDAVDKINQLNIRPVLFDSEMYTIQYVVTDGVDYNNPNNSHSENDSVYKGVIRGALKARKSYKGSGKPTFYTTEDLLTELLLIEDQNGRLIYDSVEKLATTLRVKEIVTIPELEQLTDVYGIIVNLNDYTAGADKGGSVNMFDDFDIDYNQMKYLMETRMSGALTVPYSAIALRKTAYVPEEEVQG